MHPIDAHVGGKIATRRHALGWSIEELAARTDLPVPRLQAYEAGECRAPSAELVTLSAALRVLPGYFFEDVPDKLNASKRPASNDWLKDWPEE